MLSPQERRLILAVFSILLIGAVVKSCRGDVVVKDIPRPEPALREELESPPAQGPD